MGRNHVTNIRGLSRKISSVCEYCRRSAAVTTVRMRAEFVDSVARHGRNLQAFEQCLHVMRSVIRFLNAKNMKPAEIHQLCDVYGEHAMSSSVVRR